MDSIRIEFNATAGFNVQEIGLGNVTYEYCQPNDFDGDGIINSLDLDSDNDGIVDAREGYAPDLDNNGLVGNGTGAGISDVDGDGLADVVDPSQGAAPAQVPNTDNNGLPDFLDLDSDGDGIPDNIEAQPTTGAIAYVATDTDGDGIPNVYDNFVGFGGTGLIPVNTDGFDYTDYQDLDSDNDGQFDKTEGFDTNGDDVLLTGERYAKFYADTDGDGIDDAYDLNNASSVPNNNGQTAASFPLVEGGANRDWRAVETGVFPCAGELQITRQVTTPSTATLLDFVTFTAGDFNITSQVSYAGILLNGSYYYNGYIYAMKHNAGANNTLYQLRTDGTTSTFLLAAPFPTATAFNTAGVTKDGKAYFKESGNNQNLYIVDMNDLAVTLVQTTGAPNLTTGDLVVDPIDGKILQWYHNNGGTTNGGLYEINPVSFAMTKVGTAPFPTNTIGAMMFDDNGNLYGYGSPPGGGNQDRFFTMNKTTSQITQFGTPDISVTQADGCACPFKASLSKDINVTTVTQSNCVPATFAYTATLFNYGSQPLTGSVYRDTLDSRLSISTPAATLQATLRTLFGPSVIVTYSDYAGGTDNLLTITGMVLPLGQRSFSYSISTNGMFYNGQVYLSGSYLTEVPGGFIVSDYPGSSNINDRTPVIINTDYDCDGVADADDIDDDNDGIIDTQENGGVDPLADADIDGIPNYLDPTFPGFVDTDADGVNDNFDKDKDGIINQYDLDSDNDGIADIVEAGGVDTDGDGRIDNLTDTDGDGLMDQYDATTGGDNITNGDMDGDGVPNYLDLDADNDGIPDVVEAGGVDNNGDGLLDNYNDADRDGFDDNVDGDANNDGTAENTTNVLIITGNDGNNDGVPDSYPQGIANIDGNGMPNFLDLDSDNDGLSDIAEVGGTDADNDGLIDGYTDDDSDGWSQNVDGDQNNDGTIDNAGGVLITTGVDADVDGKPDTYPIDNADGNGLPNFLDLDADNDGIADLVEAGGVDTNGDGVIDATTDTDSDGWIDLYDANNGGDAIANLDTDGDGIRNYLDLDADNDGIADVVEAGGVDNNGDGRLDNYNDTDRDGFDDNVDGDVGNDGTAEATANALVLTGIDTNSDGVPNSYPQGIANIDGNGMPNFLDLDSDNDGIQDIIEVGGTDATNDGLVDGYTDTDNDGWSQNVDGDQNNDGTIDNAGGVLITTGTDGNNNGKPDSYPIDNADATGLPNFIDIDADDDGIVDNTEAQATASYIAPSGNDSDNDGIDNAYDGSVAFGGAGVVPVNTDAADNPDYLDLDTDNDGVGDLIEGHDIDANGVADAASPANNGVSGGTTDIDNDGLLDGFDNNTASTIATNTGLNPSSHPNADDASTAERDWRETADRDHDGIPNNIDIDDDNDGILDVTEGGGTDPTGDHDGDGAPNYADVNFPGFVDNNGDGINDNFDHDKDGIPDLYDLDSDNDGVPDIVEAGGVDTDGDGRIDDLTDTDNDGLMDQYDSTTGGDDITNGDVDGDGIPNYLDLDSDNDGIADVVEAGGTDTNGDGIADDYADVDKDGFNDVVDGDPNNDGTPDNTADALVVTGTDTDNDGIPNDYPNNDGDNDGHLNPYDLDSDNDGIADVVEANGTDTNGDGIADNYVDTDGDGFNDVVDGDVNNDGVAENSTDALVLTGSDTDGDGNPNSYPEDDPDGDGILNPYDLDADNDGIADVVEALGTDANGDGLADNYADTDNDGFNDVVDGDVGNDGTAENSMDALITTGNDANNDGTPDSYPNGNFDGDGFYNFIDLDADNDGAQDILEAGGTDANGDGLVDGYSDTDGDGWSQNVDGDTDNNGTPDNAAAVLIITGTDSNGDGTPSDYPFADDIDGDRFLNYLDLDSDNDGITDVVENNSGVLSGAADSDNPNGAGGLDGYVGNGSITDGNTNGWHDPSQGATTLTDTDGDGIADMYDIDADNDGIADFVEGTCSTCPTFDPTTLPANPDANNNGVLDFFENLTNANANGGTNVGLSPNEDDNDGIDGVVDYLDLDTDNDGHMDWAEGFDNGYGGTTAGNGNAAPEVINMAAAFNTAFELAYGGTSPHYPTTDADGDGLPIWLDSDDATPGYSISTQPPFLNPASPYWLDLDNDGLADIFDYYNNIDGYVLGNLAPVPDNDAANDRDWRDNNTVVDFPIELLYFNAEKQGNEALLTWSTLTEINNDYFEVLRSINGIEFVKIGEVKGAGTTTEQQFYSLIDHAPFNGINYYRLRQVDFDQTATLSDIRVLDFSKPTTARVFPNPTHGIVNIEVNATLTHDLRIEVLDVLGRTLLSHTVAPAATIINTQVDLTELPAASYMIRLTSDNQVIKLEKVVKVNP